MPAYVIDQNTGTTIATFGLEQEPGEYRAERWALLRSYRVSATGPGGHSWPHWIGALLMLLVTFGLIASHV